MKDPETEVFGSESLKGNLKKENRLYKTALDHEVSELTDDAKQVGKIALIAGGVLVGTYLIAKLLKPSKTAEEKEHDGKNKNFLEAAKTQIIVEKPKKESKFLSIIMEQLALILIGIVQEKLAEITNTDKKKLEERKDELLNGNSRK